MTISAALVAPERAREALAHAISAAKRDDPLAPVTVAVPTNTCGVMTRRALGRSHGIVGVDMVTLNRIAELIAGPQLAAAGRSPMSAPVIDLTIASILADDPGPFAAVAAHPSTILALRDAHQELRLTRPGGPSLLAEASRRGRHVVRLSDAVTASLAADWYDEADLLIGATAAVAQRPPTDLRNLVIHLPQDLPGRTIEFVRAIGAAIEVDLVLSVTGDATVDADAHRLVESLGASISRRDTVRARRRPAALVSTTDADDEVRAGVRMIVDAARDGTPFERIALLWPAERPYARLAEHHLTAAELPWNGRPGTSVVERLAPRLLLDLLDVDRRGLRRRSVFDLLADVPARDDDGIYLPTAGWERVSRRAGVARDDDWDRRLAAISVNDRWQESADSLRGFVRNLRDQLGHPAATRPWSEWASWSTRQVEEWLGRHTIDRLPEPEYRAWEAMNHALDRLGHLDPVGEPITRHRFRSTLIAELESAPAREGRVGNGVTVGPLAGAVGLDVDVAIVLGAAEGLLPPTPQSNPLLSEADRELAGLPTADTNGRRLHRQFLDTLATSAVTVTLPRGDLRSTTRTQPSRWIADWADDIDPIASHHAGVQTASFPPSTLEHRLRAEYRRVRAGTLDTGDQILARGLRLDAARRSADLTQFDGDLTGTELPRLDGAVSPSRLESWTACPHAYFAHYLLDVAPIDEPSAAISISGRDRGSAHHDALDRFHRSVIEGALPQPGPEGWTADHRGALIDCFNEVSEQTERRGRTGRPAFWADERDRMLADLLGWLEHDSEYVQRRGSVVLASELRFGDDDRAAIRLPDGRTIALRGSIDRVDRAADGSLVVTDHKSGRKDAFKAMTADDPTAGGSLFQLPAYAAAARAHFGEGDTPVRAEYGLLRKGGYDRPGLTMTAEVDQLVQIALAAVVEGIETGYYPHRPERPGWRMFVQCEYCEPDHLGTADRWTEWQRKHADPRLDRWFGADA